MPRRPKKEDLKKSIYLLPSLLTTASLFCGFLAILKAISGDYPVSAWLIFTAGVFDLLDGRVARLTKTSSEFGVQYDSLCDLISFGVAPAVLVYQWTLKDFGRLGIALSFLFFVCGALRLARYNVHAGDETKSKDFQGLPIPMAAGTLITLIAFYHHWFGDMAPYKFKWMLILVPCVSLLMISNVQYNSFKKETSDKHTPFYSLVALILFFVLTLVYPHEIGIIAAMAYFISGPTIYAAGLFKKKPELLLAAEAASTHDNS